MILLVEDNEDDEELTLRAFKRHQLLDEVVVVRTGEEALDFVFSAGLHAGRDTALAPVLILLDLNLPKIDGHEVLRQIRADERTKDLRVVVLTSSKKDEVTYSNVSGPTRYIRKPVAFPELADAARKLGLAWPPAGPPLPRP
jgi:two-component system response regulator